MASTLWPYTGIMMSGCLLLFRLIAGITCWYCSMGWRHWWWGYDFANIFMKTCERYLLLKLLHPLWEFVVFTLIVFNHYRQFIPTFLSIWLIRKSPVLHRLNILPITYVLHLILSLIDLLLRVRWKHYILHLFFQRTCNSTCLWCLASWCPSNWGALCSEVVFK